MWLHLIGMIAISLSSVQTLAITYPYRTLLPHDTARTTDQIKAPQGFLIYLDNSGVERIVSFNYAEPVYAIRRINFIANEIPIIQVPDKFLPDDSSEANKAREAHFRAWSLHQYQVLKREIDFLRGEGKEPSIEMLLKFIPLEKIALTSDYYKIAELPEIKRIREEHLNIWNQVQQTDEDQIKLGIKTSSIDKSAAEKLALENQKKQLELQNDKLNQLNIGKASKYVGALKTEALLGFANEINNKSEIINKEAFESNENLVRAPSEDDKNNFKTSKQELGGTGYSINKLNDPNTRIKTTDNKLSEEDKKQQTIEQTVIAEKQSNMSSVTEHEQALHILDISDLQMQTKKQILDVSKKRHSEIEQLISTAAPVYVPQQVVDTAEVMRAREEHLKIVSQAIMKAKLAQTQQKQLKEISTLLPHIISNGTAVESKKVMPLAE